MVVGGSATVECESTFKRVHSTPSIDKWPIQAQRMAWVCLILSTQCICVFLLPFHPVTVSLRLCHSRSSQDERDPFPSSDSASLHPQLGQDSDEEDGDEFVYPGAGAEEVVRSTANDSSSPSPAQLESLYAAASSGDLPLLQRLFKNATETSNTQPFSLANDATSRTGFTVLHAAASRGYLNIVTWRASSAFISVYLKTQRQLSRRKLRRNARRRRSGRRSGYRFLL